MRILFYGAVLLFSSCSHLEPTQSLKPAQPPAIRHESSRLNASVSVDAFKLEDQGCFYVASVQHSDHQGSIRFVAGTTDTVTIQGVVDKGFQSCKVTVQDYQRNMALLLNETRQRLPEIKLVTLDTGTVVKSPLLEDFHRKVALSSLKDPGMIEIRRNGEKRSTLNQVFNGLVTKENLFADFIRVHHEIGLDLEYDGVEKVFRNRVEASPYREQLLAAGAKPKDQIISGAGIYRFTVKNP